MEIERKFLLSSIPRSEVGIGKHIKQGYILIRPLEVRLRRKGSRYYLTKKGKGTLSRSEWQRATPAPFFWLLWLLTFGFRVEKTRYIVKWGGHTLEIDEYHKPVFEQAILECEFETEAEAKKFTPPNWANVVREVTEDPAYKNRNLAAYGFPH